MPQLRLGIILKVILWSLLLIFGFNLLTKWLHELRAPPPQPDRPKPYDYDSVLRVHER